MSTVDSDIAHLHAPTAAAKGIAFRVAAQDAELLLDLGKVRRIVENLVGPVASEGRQLRVRLPLPARW